MGNEARETILALADRVRESKHFHYIEETGDPCFIQCFRYTPSADKREPEAIQDKVKARSNNLIRLLGLYAKKYSEEATPRAPTAAEVDQELGGKVTLPVEIGKLNKTLRWCFTLDRSLWKDQRYLHIPSRTDPLELRPLSELLQPTMKFWFLQSLPLLHEFNKRVVTFSEPLFFSSKSLNGYFRFLDVDYDRRFEEEAMKELASRARTQMKEALMKRVAPRGKDPRLVREIVSQVIEELDLVPTRNYVPAGDSKSAVEIRGWFRRVFNERIIYEESSGISEADRSDANLIVLASRPSLWLLRDFQKENEGKLKLELTDTGITEVTGIKNGKIERKPYKADIKKGTVYSEAHVIVTNWTCRTGNIHTFIASNHTRALLAVSRLLLDNKALQGMSSRLVDANGDIPKRLQLAFRVPLEEQELHPLPPECIGSFVYPRDSPAAAAQSA